MAKQRKSRKVGLIGVRKDPDYVHEKSSGRVKKHKGKPPGSRHNVETTKSQTSGGAVSKDPRHGSKKPVQLVKSPVKPAQRKYATPAEELAALEADGRLSALLDKLDEGKTLTATFAAYLNALVGKGVHVVTVNEYLAKRDSEWMGKVFAALGMTTGVIWSDMPNDAKLAAYQEEMGKPDKSNKSAKQKKLERAAKRRTGKFIMDE